MDYGPSPQHGPWGGWQDAACAQCALAHVLAGGSGAGLPEAAGGGLRILQKKGYVIFPIASNGKKNYYLSAYLYYHGKVNPPVYTVRGTYLHWF